MNRSTEKEIHTFRGTRRRKATSSHPYRHGSVRWWRGEIHIEGVTLSVVASPRGISLPAGVSLDDSLHERAEAHLMNEAAKLNRHQETPVGRGGDGHG